MYRIVSVHIRFFLIIFYYFTVNKKTSETNVGDSHCRISYLFGLIALKSCKQTQHVKVDEQNTN